MPLSNLNFASLFISSSFAVFLVIAGSKYADSIKIFFVFNSVPDLIPPIIPPKPRAPSSSDITHIFSFNIYVLLSRALRDSPFIEFLTLIEFLILSKSYACSGLFKSNIT